MTDTPDRPALAVGFTPADVELGRILPPRPTAASATGKSISTLGFASTPILRALRDDDPARYAGTYGDPSDPVRLAYDWEVVDGERRIDDLRTAHAGRIVANVGDVLVHCLTIPADAPDATVAALRLALNLARQPNPIREAEGIKEMNRAGYDDVAISGLLGISRGTISKRRRLLSLPQLIRDGVAGGKVGPSVAYKLANLPSMYHEEALRVLASTGRFTGDDLKAVTTARRGATVAALPDDLFAMPDTYDPDKSPRVGGGRSSDDDAVSTENLTVVQFDAGLDYATAVFRVAAEAYLASGGKVREARELVRLANAAAGERRSDDDQ